MTSWTTARSPRTAPRSTPTDPLSRCPASRAPPCSATPVTPTTTPTACRTPCPTTAARCPNPGQEPGPDPRYGLACPPVDDDGDDIVNEDDNCDLAPNPSQSDLDGDDRGDACDSDRDGDRFNDAFDNCPTVYNLEPTDINGDGLVNDQLDRDRDGIGTACDADEPVIQAPPLRPPAGRPRPIAADRASAPPSGAASAWPRCAPGLWSACAARRPARATAELVLDRATARRLGLRRSRVVAGGVGAAGGPGHARTHSYVSPRPLAERCSGVASVRSTLTAIAVDPGGQPHGPRGERVALKSLSGRTAAVRCMIAAPGRPSRRWERCSAL